MSGIHTLVEQRAQTSPNSIAVSCENQNSSYADIVDRANRIAQALIVLGAREGTFVGIVQQRSSEFIASVLGVLKTGACCVPIDAANPLDRAQYIAGEANLLAYLVDDSTAATQLENSRRIHVLEALENRSSARCSADVADSSPAFLFFTSGSTGRPKGVLMSHGARIASVLWLTQCFGAPRTHLFKSSISHNPMVREIFWPLVTGGTSIVAPGSTHMDMGYLTRLIRTHSMEVAGFTPSMLKVFLEAISPEDCQSIKYLICGGEPIDRATVDHFFTKMPDAHLMRFYGLTEVGMALHLDVRPGSDHRSLGYPTYMNVHVLDSNLRSVPDGQIGELCISGVGLADGYFKDQSRTEASFLNDPFTPGLKMFRTGDHVFRTKEGEYIYHGRRDRMIKLRGVRVELSEVEDAVCRLPPVSKSIAMVTNKGGRVQLHCFCTLQPDATYTSSRIVSELHQQLPTTMMPHRVHIVEAIPLLPNGKVDYRKLESLAGQRPQRSDEDHLAEIPGSFERILRTDNISLEDRIYSDLGADSLIAIELAIAFEQQYGIELSSELLRNDPSIREILNFAAVSHDENRLKPADRRDQQPASFQLSAAQVIALRSPAPWMHFLLQIKGNLDPERFEAAINQCLRENQLAGLEVDASRELVIGQDTVAANDAIELILLNGSEKECVLAAHSLLDEFAHCSDDSHVPLRLRIVSVAPTSFVALFRFSAVFFDGYSIDLFCRRVSQIYEARSPAEVAARGTKVSLADVSRWERATYGDLAFLRGSFAREQQALREAWRRMPSREYAGVNRSRCEAIVTRKKLSKEIGEQLVRLAGSAQISRTRVFLGVLALGLARLHGSQKAVLDVMSSNRVEEGFRRAIAPLSVRIPLLFDFGSSSVPEIIEQFRAATEPLHVQHPPLPLLIAATEGEAFATPRILVSQIVGGMTGFSLADNTITLPKEDTSDAQTHVIDSFTDLIVRFSSASDRWMLKFIHRAGAEESALIDSIVRELSSTIGALDEHKSG